MVFLSIGIFNHPFASNRHSGVILVRNPANLAVLAAFLPVITGRRTEYKIHPKAIRVWVRLPPPAPVFR
jgi:hypothetical protein